MFTEHTWNFTLTVFFTCDLNFCLDSTNDCNVIPSGEAYEIFHPGRSSKSAKHSLKQFKPHAKLKPLGSYRGFPDAFITPQKLVDFFLWPERNENLEGTFFIDCWLANLLLMLMIVLSKSPSVQNLSELKEKWIKEVVVGVCQDIMRDMASNGKFERDTLKDISKKENILCL